jgi:hypothetical protein
MEFAMKTIGPRQIAAGVGTAIGAVSLAVAAGGPVSVAPGTMVPTEPTLPSALVTEQVRLAGIPSENKSLSELRELQGQAQKLQASADSFGGEVRTSRIAQERRLSANPVAWVNPFNQEVRAAKATYVDPLWSAEQKANRLESRAENLAQDFKAAADNKDPVVLQKRLEDEQRRNNERTQCQLLGTGPGCIDGNYVGF